MPLYEHVFLTRQDVSNSQVDSLTKEYTELIEKSGGKVARTEYWGLKTLAYKIKKNRKAHYTMLNIDAGPEAVAEMERQMGLSTDVIRFMTLRVDAHENEPTAMMRKSDRDDRGGRGGRGGPRGDRPPRGDRGDRGDRGGDRGERSTFRARPPREDSASNSENA